MVRAQVERASYVMLLLRHVWEQVRSTATRSFYLHMRTPLDGSQNEAEIEYTSSYFFHLLRGFSSSHAIYHLQRLAR
jgi:hypothetical protein